LNKNNVEAPKIEIAKQKESTELMEVWK
jgi:hypothetical protein